MYIYIYIVLFNLHLAQTMLIYSMEREQTLNKTYQ